MLLVKVIKIIILLISLLFVKTDKLKSLNGQEGSKGSPGGRSGGCSRYSPSKQTMQRYTELRYQPDVKGNREKGGEGDEGWRKEKKEKRIKEGGRGTDPEQNCEHATGKCQLICTNPKWGNTNHSYL